jgi:ABC-2 type transport system permease protein
VKRPMYWSVRRELWENRSIYVAPFAIAVLTLFGFFLHVGKFADGIRSSATAAPARQVLDAVIPFGMTASAILFVGVLVAVFYCADALNGERRDRSILFWKSMPVSDRTTVLSKALTAIVVVPLVAFAFALSVQLVMLLGSLAVLAAKGIDPGTLLSRLPPSMPVAMLYGVAAHALWYAPIYAWLLVISAWTRRAPLLWAALPFFAAIVVEMLAFGSSHVLSLVKYRVTGAMAEAFAADATKTPIVYLHQLDPVKFLSSPGLWLGLVFAAGCLVVAIRVRRHREPN